MLRYVRLSSSASSAQRNLVNLTNVNNYIINTIKHANANINHYKLLKSSHHPRRILYYHTNKLLFNESASTDKNTDSDNFNDNTDIVGQKKNRQVFSTVSVR